jgi:hypothetical protein
MSHMGPGNIVHHLRLFEGGTMRVAIVLKMEGLGLPLTASTYSTVPYNLARQVRWLGKMPELNEGRYALIACLFCS